MDQIYREVTIEVLEAVEGGSFESDMWQVRRRYGSLIVLECIRQLRADLEGDRDADDHRVQE